MQSLKIHYPEDLPVASRRDEIMEAISENQVLVIAGATGSGKTTQIPKMCLELGRESIAHTQPRRIAARSVAERIARELSVDIGGLVGYQVRFTDKMSKNTKVKVMTDGILLASLQNDLELRRYDTVIIDEAHERSLNIDFLLGYLKRLISQRPELKVIITSATIDPESFSKHFADAPIIEVSGRTYPIEVRYRPVAQEDSEGDVDESNIASDFIDGIAKGLAELEQEEIGDTLVFLSGESEIRDAQEVIEGQVSSGLLSKNTEVLPLFGRLSAADQHRVFSPRPNGMSRRVVLATNVAETSLTIPGIKYVIDTGTARISRYSPRAKVQRLPIEAISQASANQRAGRAGRTSSGIAIRLYSEDDYNSRSEFTDPEILRTNLAAVILQAATIGINDLASFPFLQPPDSRGVKDGLGLLRELGALEKSADSNVELTDLGRELSKLPIEPRFARMIIESRQHGVTREILAIVSGLTIQDPRERPLEKREQATQQHKRFQDPTSDFLTLINLWNYIEEQQRALSSSAFRRLCKREFLNYMRIREWQDLMRQLRDILKPLGYKVQAPKVNPEGIHKSLLSGLLSQLGLRQDPEKPAPGKKPRPSRDYLGSNGKKFLIFPGSALAKKPPEAIMSAELVETSALYARMNASIDTSWAEEIAGELCKRSYSEPHWEKQQGAVIGYERVVLFGLPIVTRRKMQYSRIDPMLSRELFIRHALVDGEWNSPQQFEKRNQEILHDLAQLAERTRNPQLIPDEEDLFQFFNNRIPLDVFSTRSFEGWWKKARRGNPELLTISQEKLYGDRVEEPTEADNPSVWSQDGQQLKLSYRFDPGAIDDGVTVEVPLALLSSLSPDNFDWLIPSMRQQLVTEMIRSLPKAIRKHVVPAADWAHKAIDVLPEQPTGNLTDLLAETLQKLAGVRITADDFDVEKLPTSLRMTFRVVDDQGEEIALDNDLPRLREKLKEVSQGAVATVATEMHSDLERELTEWDFDSLPSEITLNVGENQVRAFPTIARVKKGRVFIKVFSLPSDQLAKHASGVAELVRMATPSVAKYVEEHLLSDEKLAIASLGYHNVEAFVQDTYFALALRELRQIQPDGLVFERKQYEAIRNQVQAVALDECFAVSKILNSISANQREALREISDASAMQFLGVLASEKDRINQLTPKNMVSTVGLERLGRIAVYLKAVTLRVQKLAENPGRDIENAKELEKAITVFENYGGEIPLGPEAGGKLVEARWLLEELRISLFAQSLGTTETVSVQRIKKLLSS